MTDTPVIPFAELKRQARAARSRHPLAKKPGKGGRGSRVRRARASGIHPPASQKLTQKGVPALPAVDVTRIDSVTESQPSELDCASLSSSVATNAVTLPPGAPLTAIPCDSRRFDAADLPPEPPPHPWGDNSLQCAVYARPFNPRILLVAFPEGHHGRVICHPKERIRFCPGDILWVKVAAGKDLYIIAGRYNRRGKRVA